jgi:hypothetical protein
MTEKKKRPAHRPTKYDPKYCEEILEFFDIPYTKMVTKTKYTEKQGKIEYEVEEANSLPTFERFSVDIGVHRGTLRRWCDNYPEFRTAYKKAQEYQKAMLMDLAMRGFYNPTFTIFTAKNITDMRDKVEQEITTKIPTIIYNKQDEKRALKELEKEIGIKLPRNKIKEISK